MHIVLCNAETLMSILLVTDRRILLSWSAWLVEVFQALHHQQVSDQIYYIITYLGGFINSMLAKD